MTKDKKDAGTEAGPVFSFDENAGDVAQDTRRTEEPFEIPAFLRRSHPATQREPEVETPWKDDDFARILRPECRRLMSPSLAASAVASDRRFARPS